MHRIRNGSRALGLCAALLGLAQTALATSAVAPLSLKQLTQTSSQIVRGRIAAIRSVAEGNQIFTYVDVMVDAVWKGETAQRALRLRLLGGEAGGLRMRVIGNPCLSSKEEVVLFLRMAKNGALNVAGLAEGKFRVVRDRNGARVVRDLSAIDYQLGASDEFPDKLEELERAVRQVQ